MHGEGTQRLLLRIKQRNRLSPTQIHLRCRQLTNYDHLLFIVLLIYTLDPMFSAYSQIGSAKTFGFDISHIFNILACSKLR